MNKNTFSENNIQEDDEINLRSLVEVCLRNKLLISFITLIATLTSIFITLKQKSIYQGSFKIVVEEKGKNLNKSSNSLLMSTLLPSKNGDKSQEFILKSPSVLKPIYKYTKNQYILRGEKIENLSYEKWATKVLEIKFEDGTNILNIKFKDQDKKLIIDTLNLIKDRYQSYSKRDREKELINTKDYLKEQQIKLKSNFIASLKTLNEFSIQNGLGDIDGFVSLGNENIDFNTSKLIRDFTQNKSTNTYNLDFSESNLGNKKAGQRFANQFKLLEEYEALYLDLSSKLTEESQTLYDLKIKIDNLRSSLKRPNAILVKYKELLKVSSRDEKFLNIIENELMSTRLEIAKQQDPWELISEPTLADNRVSPNRTRTVLITFTLSLLLAFLLAAYKEKKSGIIYTFDELKKSVEAKFLESIISGSNLLNLKIIESFNYNYSDQKELNKLGLIVCSNYSQDKDYIQEVLKLNKNKNILITDFDNEDKLQDFENLAIILSIKNVSVKDIMLLNKYLNIYEKKVIGWFYLDKETILD